ncbi:MAG: nucleotidyltransferase domain-containing protein [Candidatus Thorarchaeota archaeon]|nr:MAG: nucleotidyltransferase domain-containing protein [Candidatus Thorarchaeota archaeon]
MSRILPSEVRSSILAQLTPTEDEVAKQASAIETLKGALENHAGSRGFQYSFLAAQGSTGKKQTQLRGASDIDLFVALDKEHYRGKLDLDARERSSAIDELMESMIDQWFIPAVANLDVQSLQKTFSQHPYLSLSMAGFDVDIVACFLLTYDELAQKGPITAMDRTIHHTEYVANHLNTTLREDVRILKSFVRTSRTYGDTCAVGRMGFTGYALELLVISTGSFDAALEAILRLDWDPVDPLERSLQTLKQDSTFKDDHIFIIDPTDTGRNVASSFDERAYDLLRILIQQLIDASQKSDNDQVMNLVLEKPIPVAPVPVWFTKHSYVREFESDGGVHYTVLRDKLHSVANRVVGELRREPTGEERFGEVISEVYFEDDRFAIGFLVEKPEISSTYERRGPPLDLQEAVDSFREVHSDAFERDDYLWIIERRKWTKAQSLIDVLLQENPVEGLKRVTQGETSAKLQHVIHRYVLRVEDDFPIPTVQG